MNNMMTLRKKLNQRKPHTKGATLVEVLVYVIITTFLISLIVYVLMAVSRLEKHVSVLRAIESSAITALEKISREVKGATSINVVQSVFGTDIGQLTLNVPDGIGGMDTLEFFVVNGIVRMERDGIDQGPLTATAASTTRLLFRLISNNDIRGVKVELSLQGGEGEYLKSKNFYSTATVRATY